MTRKIILLAALLLPTMAHAQTRPNHTLPQFQNLEAKAAPSIVRMRVLAPVGTTSDSTSVAYDPFYPQGGINHATAVPGVYSDGTAGTLAQIGQMADGSVQQTEKNAKNGVSALNDNSEATAPVNTPGNVTTKARLSQGYVSAPPSLPWTGWTDGPGHLALPSVTFDTVKQDMMSAIADHMLMVGGHNLADSVFSKFSANPYGVGDNGGCVHSVVMTYAPGTGTNCGAGGWDAVAQYEKAQNNPPWYATGDSLVDENGTKHTVTFTAHAAIVRPQLPDSYKQFMHTGAHVLTNIVSGPTIYSGLDLDGVQDHRNKDQRFYGNTLASWASGADATGTYTKLTMTGNWSPISSDGATIDSGHIPSVGSVNNQTTGQTDALDNVIYSAYSSPILIIGTYIKHFTRNTSCLVQADPNDTGGSASMQLSPSRKCDEELDNWYNGPDYGATMHGLTIVYSGNLLSSDSYGLNVSGLWPEGIRAWLGAFGHDFDGDEFKLGQRQGPPPQVNAKAMIAEWWQQPSSNTSYPESFKIWSQVDGLSSTGGTSANGQDVSYWIGPRQSASSFNIDGAFESATIYNPSWAKNGVALCGYDAMSFFGTATAGTGCLTVDTWGNTSTSGTFTAAEGGTFNGDVLIGAGKSIRLTPSSGNIIPNIYASTGNIIAFGNNAGTKVGLNALGSSILGDTSVAGTLNASGVLNIPYGTPSSSAASCTQGQIEMDADYIYSCVATNRWHRVSNGKAW